jgi:hypothetical protein
MQELSMTETNTKGALAAWVNGAGLPAVDRKAIAQALIDSANQGSTGGGDGEFLSFSGQGANYKGWTLGRNKETPDPDSIYIVDPMSALAGWTCWKGGSPTDKVEWSVYAPRNTHTTQNQLADHGPYKDGDGWKGMLGLSMLDIDAPGKKITYTSTSKSGCNTIADLTSEIGERLIAEEPEVPLIRLDDETFVAQGKSNGKPLFIVEGWVTREEVEAFLNEGDEGDLDDLLAGKYAAEPAKPVKAKRSAKKAEPVEADEPDVEEEDGDYDVIEDEVEEAETVAEVPARRARRKAAA